MRRGRRTTLLLGAVLALLTSIVLYVVLSAGSGTAKQQAVEPTPIPKAQVLVAQIDIKSFTLVKDTDVTIQEVEATQVISPSTSNPRVVVGKILTRDYKAKTQINLTDVADPGVSQLLKKGERGFVLPILEVNNFGGQLLDHDVVDVLWTRTFEVTSALMGPDGKPSQVVKQLPTTKKLLDNVRVLHVIPLRAGTNKKAQGGPVNTAPQDQGTADAAKQQAAAEAAAQGLYSKEAPFTAALVLAITDQQAEVIKFAREFGTVDLTLRAQDDNGVERTTGITDKIMIEDYGVVAPEIIVK